MSAAPVPVLVLAGFLGSGKTTLLNHLLSHSLGGRLGVIVNDFGAVGIDALMVAGQVDGVVDLGNGCVCCAVDGDDIDEVLERITAAPGGVDAVVIEASGLAEPRSLIRMLVGSDARGVRYGGLIEVVDASAFLETRRSHPELDTHVRLADLVVLGKTDLVSPAALEEVRAVLAPLCGPVPVVEAVHGRVDPALLLDEQRRPSAPVARQMTIDEMLRDGGAPGGAEAGGGHADGRPGAPARPADDGHAHPHAGYDSISFVHDGPLHPRRLIEFLESAPAGLYRTKGVVALADPEDCGTFEVQTVGRYIHARRRSVGGAASPTGSSGPHGAPATRLVAIGAGIDAAALRASLDDCRVREGEPADEQAMLSVLRYAR